MDNMFGLAQPKPEGYMIIPIEYIEDDYPLPKLPPKSVCKGVLVAGEDLNRIEYTHLLIKSQPFF